MYSSRPNALEINVTARQWAWSFTYPEGFTAKELQFAGQSASRLGYAVGGCDSFFLVPQFRIKQTFCRVAITTERIHTDSNW